MIAKKDNKEYSVTNETKNIYLKDGYDIYDDDGKIVEYSPKKTISYNEHIKEVEELKKQIANSAQNNSEDLEKENTSLKKEVEELKKQIANLTKEAKANGKVSKQEN